VFGLGSKFKKLRERKKNNEKRIETETWIKKK